MGNVVVPLTMLAGGAALVYVGITNPAGGAFVGLGNLLRGEPNTTDPASTSFGFVNDLSAALGKVATNPGVTAVAGASTAQRAKVIEVAESWLGVPYVFGGNTRHGVDCSGFTLQVYAKAAGLHLPRVSWLQAKRGRRTLTPQAGDLVAFGSPVHHVGIYLGNGQMINAPKPGSSVRIEPVDYGVHPIIYRDLLGGRVRRSKPRKGGTQR